MSVLPTILTLGIDGSRSINLIKEITSQDYTDEISRLEWSLDTKYYTANVQFRLLHCKTFSVESNANCVEAVILYIDHSIDSLLKELIEWNAALHCFHSDVKIIVSKYTMAEDQKSAVDEWCSENEYEYIELELNKESNLNCEADDNETSGIQRVLEVLQTHQWSNMQLKKNVTPGSSEHGGMNEALNLAISAMNADEQTSENPDNMEELFDLFQNLQSMKSNMSSLTEAEKLDQAEKVVKTFWNAIGGDMSEFDESDTEIT